MGARPMDYTFPSSFIFQWSQWLLRPAEHHSMTVTDLRPPSRSSRKAWRTCPQWELKNVVFSYSVPL